MFEFKFGIVTFDMAAFDRSMTLGQMLCQTIPFASHGVPLCTTAWLIRAYVSQVGSISTLTKLMLPMQSQLVS